MAETTVTRTVQWKLAAVSAAFLFAIGLGTLYAKLIAKPGDSPHQTEPPATIAINGMTIKEYPPGHHVRPMERVAYKTSPPMGGAHEQVWVACTGVVYEQPIRNENAVHSLEHGAVWITYNPELLGRQDVAALADRVQNRAYMFMSPYPALDAPFSLQSWGHQLKLNSVKDDRVDMFVSSLLRNPSTSPEPAATCAAIPGAFDPANPPPFDPTPPGDDAVADDFQDDLHP